MKFNPSEHLNLKLHQNMFDVEQNAVKHYFGVMRCKIKLIGIDVIIDLQ